MITEDNAAEQERKLDEMDYNPGEDIFNREEHIPLDGDGNPILNPGHVNDGMPYGLDIPGAEDDDNFEQITDQLPAEEDDVYNIADDEEDQFEDEDDLIDDMENEEEDENYENEDREDDIDN
ncbi:hypothetical protein [Chryseobacterium foetidum]|uniref:hypothetical protein n=1 Tax=Chryseobacterium foetidum TaxID=2951057 RepID=UPI0021C8D0E8|nr:hypothetical protein [Chryseobacterium foetidum]